MQRIADADFALNLRVAERTHDGARFDVRPTRGHIPGGHADPQLQPCDDRRSVPQRKRCARFHRLAEQIVPVVVLLLLLAAVVDGVHFAAGAAATAGGARYAQRVVVGIDVAHCHRQAGHGHHAGGAVRHRVFDALHLGEEWDGGGFGMLIFSVSVH